MHNQFLNLWWKKLSKSTGGLITVDGLQEEWFSALDLRLLYMTAHYRSFLDFNMDLLKQAQTQRKNLNKKLSNLEYVELDWDYNKVKEQLKTQEWKEFLDKCVWAICDDLNTPKLLAEINTWLRNTTPEIVWVIHRLDQVFLKLDLFEKVEEETVEIPIEVKELAEQRLQAKAEKNYALADELRNKITEMWFTIKDIPWGYEINSL